MLVARPNFKSLKCDSARRQAFYAPEGCWNILLHHHHTHHKHRLITLVLDTRKQVLIASNPDSDREEIEQRSRQFWRNNNGNKYCRYRSIAQETRAACRGRLSQDTRAAAVSERSPKNLLVRCSALLIASDAFCICSCDTLVYNWYDREVHLPRVLMMWASYPRSARVVAPPIRKLWPANMVALNPQCWARSLVAFTSWAYRSGLPSEFWNKGAPGYWRGLLSNRSLR